MFLLQIFPALACGPFIAGTYDYMDLVRPQPDLNAWVAQPVGALSPGWHDSFQVVGWRALNGKSLSPEEAKASLDVWGEELAGWHDNPFTDVWTEARKAWPNAPEYISPYATKDYADWLNCNVDAFQHAAQVLSEAPEADRSNWLAAQDRVFAACADPEAPAPEPAPARASRWLQAQRAYQIAAYQFYHQDYEAASKSFSDLAQAYPQQRALARLGAARAMIRLGSVAGDVSGWPLALNSLNKILDDKSLSEIHPSARRLKAFVQIHLDPAGRREELAEILSSQPLHRQNLRDFTILMDQQPMSEARHPLMLWLYAWHRQALPDALSVAHQQWKATQSPAWLLYILSNSTQAEPKAEAAVDQLPESHPGRTALDYALAQRQMAHGALDQARVRLDKALARPQPLESYNRLQELRARLATNVEDWLTHIQIQPVGWGYAEWDMGDWPEESEIKEFSNNYLDIKQKKHLLSQEGAWVLGMGLPQRQVDAITEKVEAQLQPRVTLSAWIRALVLNKDSSLQQHLPALQRFFPDLAPLFAEVARETTPEGRRFAATLVALRLPGSRFIPDNGFGRTTALNAIDDFRDNWWCLDPEWRGDSPFPYQMPGFLSMAEQAEVVKEQAILKGRASVQLGEIVLAWATAHPDDARAAEALAGIVKTTRFTCSGGNKEISRKAFTLLHKGWPQSTWAAKTPYWYD